MKWQNSKYGWLLGNVQPLEPGKAYRAQRGSEFLCEAESFRGYVYAAAAERGYRASTVVFGRRDLEHPVVVYVFYKPDALMRPNLAAYPIVKRIRMDIS